MQPLRPTIKGVYILSHIRAFERERGEDQLRELGVRYGKSLLIKNGDYLPVAEEVAILELIVEISSPKILSEEECALSAGHLHFKNFTSTPLWAILHPI